MRNLIIIKIVIKSGGGEVKCLCADNENPIRMQI